MSVHRLKTWRHSFDAMWSDLKTYDVRRNDRSFVVGDVLDLREWTPPDALRTEIEGYSGRRILAKIVWMTPGGNWGLPVDICVLGIRAIEKQSDVHDDDAAAQASEKGLRS